jgi:molybdate transport system ATP-binding protein
MKIEVRIKKEVRSRGGRFLLDSSFASDGDFVAIFGPSGSGKTLTLRALSGLMSPDEGKLVVGDRVLFDSAKGINTPARTRNIGYVFQDYALFPHLSVRDNVEFGLKRKWGWRISAEQKDWTEELLCAFGIEHLAGSYPAQISGGQRQRVALARALVTRPALLLLDEPFAALDTVLRARMREELLATRERFGIAMVMITHDPEDVRVLARTVVMYEEGRVASVGDSRDFQEGFKRFGRPVASGCEARAKGTPPLPPSKGDSVLGAFTGRISPLRN